MEKKTVMRRKKDIKEFDFTISYTCPNTNKIVVLEKDDYSFRGYGSECCNCGDWGYLRIVFNGKCKSCGIVHSDIHLYEW